MRDVENPMLIDTLWKGHNEAQGLENVVSQPECCGIDFYGTEIIEGDKIAIDRDNFDEIIWEKNLKQYLKEKCNFIFQGGMVLDKNCMNAFEENCLEKYLHDKYNFQFMVAE